MQVQLKETNDGSGDMFLPLGEEFCSNLGWQEGDTLLMTENDDGSFTIEKKKETELILVETISSFRIRHVVEVEKGGIDLAVDYALYDVEPVEFGQKHINQALLSTRIVKKEDLQDLYNEDNQYGNVSKSIVKL